MRAALVVLIFALTSVVSGSVVLWTSPPAAAKVCDGASVPCVVCDTGPGGGVVFYDAGGPQPWGRFLEAAPDGWFENPNYPAPAMGAVPTVPTSVRGKAGRGGVVVSWQRLPAGDNVQYYRVSSTPKSNGCRTEGASCTVRGLTPGKSYAFTVVAVNDLGESGASQPVRVKAPTAPSAPQQPVVPAPKPTPTYRWAPMAVDPNAVWCPRGAAGFESPLPTGTAIGTGRSNTQIIIAACGTSTAAGLASSYYRGGGKADWFLPSTDELNALYQQRAVVGGLAGGDFWSSSQDDGNADFARYQVFKSGGQGIGYKAIVSNRVRPVRAF